MTRPREVSSPGLRLPSRPAVPAESVSIPPRLRASPVPPALELVPDAAPPSRPPAFPLEETDAGAQSGPRVRSDRIGRLECATFGHGAPGPAPFYVVSARYEAWAIVRSLDCDLALGEEWVSVTITHDGPAADPAGWVAQFDFASLTPVSLATRERALALVNRVGDVGFRRATPGVVLRLPLARLLGSAFRVLGWPEAPAPRSGAYAMTG